MIFEHIRRGCLANVPVAVSVAVYGSILGVLAAQKQIGWLQLFIMDLAVFAGSAQFVMVEMWTPPLPIIEMTLAVVIINFRYLLIGASLRPLFQGKSFMHKLVMMHLVADENWAMTMAEYRRGTASTYFLFGGGLCVVSAWCAGTLIGHRLGAVVASPETYALDFVAVAVFTTLLMSLWRGKSDIVPWIVAAGLAMLASHVFPGKWYIVVGGVGGALAAALAWKPEDEKKSKTRERARDAIALK